MRENHKFFERSFFIFFSFFKIYNIIILYYIILYYWAVSGLVIWAEPSWVWLGRLAAQQT